MPKKPKQVDLDLNQPLDESWRKATSMSLPLAVHHRLDLLAEEARAVNPSRAEIIGALIADADLDGETLERRIVAYRKMRVADVVPGPVDGDRENVYSIVPRGPGRPAKKKPGPSVGPPVHPWPQLPDESAS